MRRFVILLAVCLLLRDAFPALNGNAAAPAPSEEKRPALFLREDPDVAHALSLAEKCEKAGAFKEAAEQYRKVLDADPEALVPVDAAGAVAPEGSDRYAGARGRALVRLAAWPPEARAVLSAQDDLAARSLWERAGADPEALGRLATRHPFSAVGDRALDRLGDVRMESGDPAGAASAWQSLMDLRPESPLQATARAKREAALALMGSGRPEPSPWQRPRATAPARPGLPRWTFAVDPGAAKARLDHERRGLEQPLPFHPLASGDLVLLAAPRGLTALDAATGRVRWASGDPSGSRRAAGPATAAVSEGLCLAVIDGRLTAFERAGGLKRWETDADLRVVTPPALDRGMAYVGLVEASGPSVAFTAAAFSVQDGRLIWRRHVTSSFDRTPFGEGMRGAALVEGGLAVFSTDLGCLMALDALTGEPRWLLRYDPFKEAERRAAIRGSQRFNPNPILASDGRLVCAPRDSAFLLCLDARDGTVLWREPRREDTDLLAVASGRILLSGPSGARALSLSDRATIWASALEIRGRGCLAEDGLALPGARGPVLLDPADGRVLHRGLWPDGEGWGGNLSASPGLVLACSAGSLAAFEPEAACRARLKDLAGRSPEGWLGLSRLALQEGDTAAAHAALARSSGAEGLAEAKADADRREALDCEARGDWAGAARAWGRCAGQAGLARAGEAWRRAARPAEALAAAHALLAGPDGGVLAWRHGSLRADTWARLAIDGILETPEGRTAYAPFEREADEALARFQPGSEETQLPAIVSRWPQSRAAARAALALGRFYAERHIGPLASRFLHLAARGSDEAAAREAAERLQALGPSARDPSVPLPELAWRMRRGGAAVPPPSPGLPLLTLGEQGLLALDPLSGRRRWSLPMSCAEPPVWSGRTLVVSGEEGGRGQLLGADAEGRVLWRNPVRARNAPLWVLPAGVLVEEPQGLSLVSPETGKTLGRAVLSGPLAAPPVSAAGLVLAVTGPSGTLPARAHWMEEGTLKVRLSKDLGPEGVEALAPCPQSGLALALLGNRRILALPLSPGEPRWTWVSEAADVGGLVAGASRAAALPLEDAEAPRLRGLDLATGRVLWRTETYGEELHDARISGGRLTAAVSWMGASGVRAWDLETGEETWRADLWEDAGSGACLPLPSGLLAWASQRDEACLLDPASGRVLRRYRDLGDAAERALPLEDGFLWIGERALAACLSLDEPARVRPLWRLRDASASSERPEEALDLADALFRIGAYGEALSALSLAGERTDAPTWPEYDARAAPWREIRALRQAETLEASRFRAPPEIDGDLRDGWDESLCRPVTAPLDLRRFRDARGVAGDWAGEGDLGGRVYTAWDEQFFYFAVDVDDQKQVVYDENNPWKGDLLIFTIDAQGEGRDLFDGGMAIQNPRARPADPASLPAGDYAARRRPDDTGTVYEAAVPWSALRKGPPSGDLLLRLNLFVADDDGEGIRKSVTPAPGLPPTRWSDGGEEPAAVSPQFFLKVKLEE